MKKGVAGGIGCHPFGFGQSKLERKGRARMGSVFGGGVEEIEGGPDFLTAILGMFAYE